MRWGLAVSAIGQTGQSDCDPFAGGVPKRGGQIDHPGGLVDGGRLHGRGLMLPERLAHDVEATGERWLISANVMI
jgi:hypothetical protein